MKRMLLCVSRENGTLGSFLPTSSQSVWEMSIKQQTWLCLPALNLFHHCVSHRVSEMHVQSLRNLCHSSLDYQSCTEKIYDIFLIQFRIHLKIREKENLKQRFTHNYLISQILIYAHLRCLTIYLQVIFK